MILQPTHELKFNEHNLKQRRIVINTGTKLPSICSLNDWPISIKPTRNERPFDLLVYVRRRLVQYD